MNNFPVKKPGVIVIRASVFFDDNTSNDQVIKIAEHFDNHFLLPGHYAEVHRFLKNEYGEIISFVKPSQNRYNKSENPVSYHMTYLLKPITAEPDAPLGELLFFFDKTFLPHKTFII